MNTDSMQELQGLVSRLIDGRLSDDEATRLDELLSNSPEALRCYHELLDNHEALCAIYPGDVYNAALDSVELPAHDVEFSPAADFKARGNWRRWALAASLLITVGLAGYLLGHGGGSALAPARRAEVQQTDRGDEQTIAGHATLRRSVDLKWSDNATSYREGDVLPDGLLRFDDGVAEIDFFCGATLIVEGPATLDIESDWSVRVASGRLRANVPPAARGFVVRAAGSDIVDLGTEFALEVGSGIARVEVIDGEVELRGGEHDGDHLVTGQRQWLKGTAQPDGAGSFNGLSTLDDLQHRRADAGAQRFAQWTKHSRQLRTDDRLIAYYPIAETQSERVVRNAASTGSSLDGKLIGPVDRTSGRFGAVSAGLEFDRPGSRVRTRIDGEFQAFTFACWVRIDSLEHVYNALFMADGYENGEPHWQIRDDGRLMFSVMVDETRDVRVPNRIDQQVVRDAGLHRVYFTEPFWDVSKSGQWFHIAAVYDPVGRRVMQYVNGEQLSSEEIIDKFHITKLQIGPAEIGNWGQPFRQTPWFAVRNLNGTMDELAIFAAALTSEDIHSLYEQGKPLGY
jgi:hypothetical protein